MSRAENFIKFQDINQMEKEIYINERIGKIVVKPLSTSKHNEFRMRSQVQKGKSGEYITDLGKFNTFIVTEQVIDPNFSNAEFLQQVGCQNAREFVERKLLSGEVFDIANKILDISGFKNNMDEIVEEAKN